MRNSIWLFLLLLLLTAGCDKNTIIHSYQPLENNQWERTDTVRFTLPALSSDDNCNMLIGLRVTNNYPYEILVMEVAQHYQHPVAHRVDTVYYRLADESGNLMKNGVNLYQYETQAVPLEQKKGQRGEVRIHHLMHKDTLPGIVDVGIHVVR